MTGRHRGNHNLARFAQLLEEAFHKGLNPYEYAAANLGISRATAYRLKRSLDAEIIPSPRTALNCISIDDDINVLISSATALNSGERLISAFRFISWIRFPRDIEKFALSVAAMVARYALVKDRTYRIDEIRPVFRRALCDIFLLDRICEFYINTGVIRRPKVDVFETSRSGQKYDHVITKMVQILLCTVDDRGRVIALQDAFDYLESRFSGIGMFVSSKWASHIWQLHSCSAPFIYLARAYPPYDCLLSPGDDQFVQDIDSWVGRSERLASFFRHALYITEILQSRLTPSQNLAAHFPIFPSVLEPLQVFRPTLEELHTRAVKPSI